MSYLRQCFGHLLSGRNCKTRRHSQPPLRLAVAGFILTAVGLALAVYFGAVRAQSAPDPITQSAPEPSASRRTPPAVEDLSAQPAVPEGPAATITVNSLADVQATDDH